MSLEFEDYAETAGIVLLAPNSGGAIWDLILNSEFGIDRTYIDNMLKWAFAHVAVDPARVSISGFSYGGTYALWLGLKNGDLFSRIAAFTPCSAVPSIRTGMPDVFISHATDDQIAPIATCSRVTVASLDSAGYVVDFLEYASLQGNGHVMTPAVRTQGMVFLARQ
jgi:predicted esterase